MAIDIGDVGHARELAERSLAVLAQDGSPAERASRLSFLGNLIATQGDDPVAARQLLEEALALARTHGLIDRVAYCLNGLAHLALDQRDYSRANQLLEEALAVSQSQGDRLRVWEALGTIGLAALDVGDDARAEAHFQQALAGGRDLGYRRGVADVLCGLGTAAARQQQPVAALRYFDDALRLAQEVGSRSSIALALEGLAELSRGSLHGQRAPTLWGAAQVLRDAGGEPMRPMDCARYQRAVEHVRSTMSQADFSAAWAEGQRLAREDQSRLLAYALGPESEPAQAAPSEPAPPRLPAGLTAREGEVLRLLAQGLSDAQIAEKLVISPRTVNSHLTSIYGKLSVSSRAAATRFAVDNGLA